MTESPSPARRVTLKDVFAFLIHPRQGVEHLAASEKPTWLLPMLVSSATALLYVVVNGYLRGQAAAMGQVQLPTDWQWWTPDMQNNYMQAMQTTQGPVFLYIMPAIGRLIGLWLSWLIVSGLLHLASTLFGGRGKMQSAQDGVAWAGLALAVRDVVRVIFMLAVNHTIASPGLSAFATVAFVGHLLQSVDLFYLWYAILMGMSLKATDNLSADKAAASVVIVLLAMLLTQAGLGTLTSKLGSMSFTRMF